MRKVTPLNDYVFKKIMGEKGDEVQLKAFLEAVLGRKLNSVEIVGTRDLTPEVIGDKLSILDVRAKTDDNTEINVEVQVRNEHNMDRRSVFYWSKVMSASLDERQDYSELPNVVMINILKYNHFKGKRGDKKFHRTYHLYEDEEMTRLTDAIEIHFIEVSKFLRLKEKDLANNAMHRWLTYLGKGADENVAKEVVAMDSAIQQANQKYEHILSDKEELHQAIMREIAIISYNTNFAAAERKGKVEGQLEGRVERGKETAYEMFIDGESMARIKKYSKLSDKELAEVLSGLPAEIQAKYSIRQP